MSQENVEIAKRSVEIYNRRDVDAFFAEVATPDLEWWPALVRAVEGGCYRGRAGIEEFLAETAETWEELQNVAEEFRDLGDCVLMMARIVGRGRGSGVPVDMPIANILDFRGGRIWRSRVYYDRAEALKALGLEE